MSFTFPVPYFVFWVMILYFQPRSPFLKLSNSFNLHPPCLEYFLFAPRTIVLVKSMSFIMAHRQHRDVNDPLNNLWPRPAPKPTGKAGMFLRVRLLCSVVLIFIPTRRSWKIWSGTNQRQHGFRYPRSDPQSQYCCTCSRPYGLQREHAKFGFSLQPLLQDTWGIASAQLQRLSLKLNRSSPDEDDVRKKKQT